MAFKMKSPYKKDNTPVYEVPFDNPNLVAKANKNGTIIVNKDLATDKKTMKEAMAHEKVHLKDMANGDLDYDADSVTYKGKKYSRASFDEGDKTLPWEVEPYKEGKKGNEPDCTPKKEKLTGPPAMQGDMGVSHEPREQDHDTVNMNERFGTAMIKKWYGPSESRGFSGGSDDEAFKIRGEEEETEKEKKAREAKENAAKEAEKDLKEDKGEHTSSSTTKTTEGKDDKGEYVETTTTTTENSKFKGEGTDQQAWDENRKGVQDKYKSFEEFQKAAQAHRDAQEGKVTETSNKVYKEKPQEPKIEVKTPDTLNLATLLHKYQVKNNIDPYDDQRKRYTPERFAKENPGFKAFIEAEQRKAVNTGSDTANDSQYDDVDQGQNINKGKKKGDENSESPVSMLVSRFKKQALRNV